MEKQGTHSASEWGEDRLANCKKRRREEKGGRGREDFTLPL